MSCNPDSLKQLYTYHLFVGLRSAKKQNRGGALSASSHGSMIAYCGFDSNQVFVPLFPLFRRNMFSGSTFRFHRGRAALTGDLRVGLILAAPEHPLRAQRGKSPCDLATTDGEESLTVRGLSGQRVDDIPGARPLHGEHRPFGRDAFIFDPIAPLWASNQPFMAICDSSHPCKPSQEWDDHAAPHTRGGGFHCDCRR